MGTKKPLVNYSGFLQPIHAGDTEQMPAPTTANASINLPHGTAPTSPADGDVWTTAAGAFVQINGVTYGLVLADPAGNVTITGNITNNPL